jgi:hypothetical protein
VGGGGRRRRKEKEKKRKEKCGQIGTHVNGGNCTQ